MTKLEEFQSLFGVDKPIIGMLHLKPLPGSRVYDGLGLDKVIESALSFVQHL